MILIAATASQEAEAAKRQAGSRCDLTSIMSDDDGGPWWPPWLALSW